ncbi:MAG: thioredoxin family protein [Bacilli bacterium]|nr:thioredoxin family protein [Bacilli bacterium]
MKKKLMLIISIIFICLLAGCTKETEETDAQKFAKEYSTLTEDNYFVYRKNEEIVKILEHGTGVIYLGFPECPWCQAYVPMLNEVADIEGLEKIYYYNILEDRKNNTETYQKIVNITKEYLQYDEEGNKRIYVPAVIVVSDGEIIGFDDETSYDTKGYDSPEDYWKEEEQSELKKRLTKMISEIIDNKCTDCNK